MRITLKTRGGHLPSAGGGRSVDVNEPAQRQELQRLVAAARAEGGVAAPAGALGAGPSPDGMSYTVTVEPGDGPRVELHASDGRMTRAFSALLDWFDRHATG